MSFAASPSLPDFAPIPADGWSLIGLGTNLPHAELAGARLLSAALTHLAGCGRPVLRVSQCRQTVAWPDPADPPFVNAVAVLRTDAASAQEVMRTLLSTEQAFGRKRGARNAPRTLDLDLLDHGGQRLTGELTLPHPRMRERRFVLEPLAEIWPTWRCPETGASAAELLERLPIE